MILHHSLGLVLKNFKSTTKIFEENKASKNAFLAVCKTIDDKCDLVLIDNLAPFGGLIGPGNSWLHNYLKYSKILRVHAAFHDAYGFMRETYGVGPGYIYILPNLPNHFLFGHISGILYWSLYKISNPLLFSKVPF